MASPILCPNCSSPVDASDALCPNCGATLPSEHSSSSVWPPPPENYQRPPVGGYENLLTGDSARDFWIGFGSVFGVQVLILAMGYFFPIILIALFGVGLVGLIAYFGIRHRYPVIARGIGWGVLAVPLFLLGAVFVCSASFMSSGRGL